MIIQDHFFFVWIAVVVIAAIVVGEVWSLEPAGSLSLPEYPVDPDMSEVETSSPSTLPLLVISVVVISITAGGLFVYQWFTGDPE